MNIDHDRRVLVEAGYAEKTEKKEESALVAHIEEVSR